MSRRQTVILAVFFILFWSVPVVAHIVGVRPGEIENRRLAERPDVALDHLIDDDYYAEWTGYLNDTFPLRSASIRTNLRIDQDIFGSSSSDVFQGTDGWLYLKRSFTRPCEVELTSEAAAALFAQFVDDVKVPTASIVAPSKFRIAPEFLGDDGDREAACALETGVALTAALDAANIDGYHNMWTVLGEIGEGEDVYFRTDTHWRDTGAIAMVQQVATELNLGWDDDWVVSKGPIAWEGDLPRIQGTASSETTERLVIQRPGVEVTRIDDADPGLRLVHYRAESSGESKLLEGETLVLHDSFFAPGQSDHVMASFAQFSEKTTYLHLDGLDDDGVDLSELLGSADRVVVEVAERLFAGRIQELVDDGVISTPNG
jgi:alginate O-acetyltransferase complex protein AlgJ